MAAAAAAEAPGWSAEGLDAAAWRIMDKHFRDTKSLVKHQLDTFDAFVSTGIDQVVGSYSPVEVCSAPPGAGQPPEIRYTVTPSAVTIGRCITHDKHGKASLLLPNDARLRNLTYGAQLSFDLELCAERRGPDGQPVSTQRKRIRGVNLGTVPVMVGSRYCTLSDRRFRGDECRYDPTGYFIVNGNEKALVSLDRIAENKTYVFSGAKSGGDCLISEVRSVSAENPGCPKTTSVVMNMRATPDGNSIRASINSVRAELPVAVVFRALGVASDREILAWVTRLAAPLGVSAADVAADMAGSLSEGGAAAYTEQDALAYIRKHTSIGQSGSPWGRSMTPAQMLAAVRALLRDDLFPHAGPGARGKVAYLSYMIAKLLRVKYGLAGMDDRDSYVNKRIDTPGALMTSLFRQHYSKFVREMRTMMHKEMTSGSWRTTNQPINLLNMNNLYNIVRPMIITSGMTYALATGNWGIKNSRTCKQGVAQVLNRMTYNATISHLRRINTRIEKAGKLVQPRKLHPTHWGVVCLSETPEGSSIGLVKNLALTACVTLHSPARAAVRAALEAGVRPLAADRNDGGGGGGVESGGDGDAPPAAAETLVLVNGEVLGTTGDPAALHRELRSRKRDGRISPFAGVVWDVFAGEVRVVTEAGRCSRPVLTVGADGVPDVCRLPPGALAGMTLPELVMGRRRGGAAPDTPPVVEYLDVDESDHALIAMDAGELAGGGRRRWTHVELTPAVALGAVAATIPFSHHNQSPRNTYQCAMAKQAIGVYSTSYRARHDTMVHVLDYPQRPVVNTRMASRLFADALPSGINAVVAIATHTGFNQEDSVIVNASAVQRGLFSSTFYRTYKEHNSRNHSTGEEEHYYSPASCANLPPTLKAFNYDKLQPCGFVPEDAWVDSRDIIIGKYMPHKHNGAVATRDCSVSVRSNESGYVDANCYNNNRFPTTTADGYSFCKVRLRSTRRPTIGDKFSSRHGQKGTVGIVRAEADMPVSLDGVVPDIIINPHAIPSRMSVGQLMECVLGKRCCMTGEYGDATPFAGADIRTIGAELEAHGLHRHGDEVFVSGSTGELMRSAIFVGPTYYQRLKHMTTDKCHSRSANGPVTALVRQPAEGRARDGGLRLGEMEVHCMYAHGAMHFLKERIFDCSDGFRVFACSRCGQMANVNADAGVHDCRACGNTTGFGELRIPYAFKLLAQECEAIGIGMRFNK